MSQGSVAYDQHPTIDVRACGTALRGWRAIAGEIGARVREAREAGQAREAREAGQARQAREAHEAQQSRETRQSRQCVVVAIECYPGTDYARLKEGLVDRLRPDLSLFADDFAQDAATVQARVADAITDDRVFGVLSHYRLEQFFDASRVARARRIIGGQASGLIVVYGTGAALLAPNAQLLVYADLTRWEIQLRQRAGAANWKADNADEDQLRKFKRGYFFEWRMADREKRRLHGRIDYLLDVNRADDPRMVPGEAYRSALAQAAHGPFRLVPYFDESVWGGHWIQRHFGVNADAPNVGWGFDGVPEENSLLLRFSAEEGAGSAPAAASFPAAAPAGKEAAPVAAEAGDDASVLVEVPAINLVHEEPDALLGERVHARFGEEFPIRFDYLDTVGGGNLSLQVHPTTGYAQDRFGIPYTQDESYYILDATPDSHVYLGVHEGVTREELVGALERAQTGAESFDAERYSNRIPVSKHDHVSIPAGTVHCSGSDTVVLEISATPYIFTFKLWDWGRVGLDGLPRPINIEHGAHVIREEMCGERLERELVDRVAESHERPADETPQPGVRSERTGLHALEFIETRRHWFAGEVRLSCHGSVNMLCLVEGEAAVVEPVSTAPAAAPVGPGTAARPDGQAARPDGQAACPDGQTAAARPFAPLTVRFGETFIVPESVGEYVVRNTGDRSREAAVVQAYVRGME